MFQFLLGKRKGVPDARVPDERRFYAIGDIHGRHDCLVTLLAAIDDDAARAGQPYQLIFLGDLIDRGPDSARVVEHLMSIAEARPDTILLMGNHEEVLLLAASGNRNALSLFNRIGGRETLLSYGVSQAEYDEADLSELQKLIIRNVPEAHLTFMAQFAQSVTIGDYHFVHAGVRPGIPLDEQRDSDRRWIREEFTRFTGDHGAVIVHGHTVTTEVEMLPNRIGIDTGAYQSGRLTALGLTGSERWILQS
ncbi:serine/threonine protein phosphatase [Sphingomonas sp. SFZ2018-12]|uniref:metallophosphoesterase family protein n=1 Tax=Sphingomonas sp. SFZ2018-12 TaxID=2683197 RepID=UPI001F0DB48D|nr:metallophosphoesterase family protein [Sphingomonas sp. SFZ2018-12]MCH4891862.1 serine/threonine protein phosphatase [Sphingomonas sp. SFZ2018-12]